ncbi:MAG: flagellar biosynthetic protein FliQ [Acidobacteriota bacterium]
MTEALAISLARETLMTALMISGPVLVVSLAVGVLISVMQVATSIQDITLTFVPKIIAVVFTILFIFSWALQMMIAFAGHLLRNFPEILA